MPNWKKIVREKLTEEKTAKGGLPPAYRDDVIRELAAHLEECYAEARSEGLADDAALSYTLQEVPDWHVLAEEIRHAKPQEDNMNHRTKTLWLPGIATSFLAGLILLFLDRAPLLQRFLWIAGMALLFCAVAEESNRLSPRTRNFWLPGFISMTAAGLFLFAADFMSGPYDPSYFFTKISLHPQDLLRLDSGPIRTFYVAWLLVQILFGALGAYFSRSAGGTRAARIVSGALPTIAMFGLCTVAVPVSFLVAVSSVVAGKAMPAQAPLALGIFVWGVAPAITMLLGAAPFLKEAHGRRAAL